MEGHSGRSAHEKGNVLTPSSPPGTVGPDVGATVGAGEGAPVIAGVAGGAVGPGDGTGVGACSENVNRCPGNIPQFFRGAWRVEDGCSGCFSLHSLRIGARAFRAPMRWG